MPVEREKKAAVEAEFRCPGLVDLDVVMQGCLVQDV